MGVNIKKLLKTSLQLSLVLLCIGVSISPKVSAHVLKQNNGTSVILHILPDDNPAAGKPQELDMSFGGSKSGFSLPDCSCMIEIKDSGKSLMRLPLQPAAPGATQTAKISVTFPKAAAYNIIITGASKDGHFLPFKLEYLQRVTPDPALNLTTDNSAAKQEVGLVSIAAIIILFMIALNVVRQSARYA